MIATHPLAAAFDVFEPRLETTNLRWAVDYAWTFDGKPYQHDQYPHIGAPGGPEDALDDPEIRRIIEQWATRLGKTFLGQVAMLKKADCDPCPMLFASSTEQAATDVVKRTYQMMGHSNRMRAHLRPEHLRTQKRIDYKACQCWIAWARSTTTLADKEVEFGHASEVDKWEHAGAASNKAKEADPFKLFMERFKNRQSHSKIIVESTPTIKGKSRIEALRLNSSNCQFHVPCPHCERYQVLDFDRVKWDKNEAGKSTVDLARRTARYECAHCEKTIHDHHRPMMLRLGVWCPEGCTVKDVEAKCAAQRRISIVHGGTDGDSLMADQWRGWKYADWIEGPPLRDGPDAGYQLSSLYAMSLSWGDVAAEFVGSKDKPQELRNFINSWLAKTWEITNRETTWETLGKRVIIETHRLLIPAWASLLTLGIDRQSEGGDRMPWVVDAWGPEGRVHTVAYGEAESFEELKANIILPTWNYEDSGSLTIAMGLMDAGHKPHGVHDFCVEMQSRHARQIHACKGSNQALTSEYQVVTLGENTARPGGKLVHVDTIRSQLWIEQQLTCEPTNYSLYSGSLLEHQDFLEQLLNDAAVHKLDNSNHARESWNRVDENVPNDFRDCRRYAWVAMLIWQRGRPVEARKREPDTPKRSSVVASGFGGREGGSWL